MKHGMEKFRGNIRRKKKDEPHERKNNENEKSSADLFKELDEFL